EIQDIADDIDNRLKYVKICDPAIGSGAFPMGLLRELFLCRCVIEPNAASHAADVKRHIIQNNIYGVDIERGAVDIARLRFWLSLIVDEAEPITLPNLDFKIMQGNSLLESYMGVDLTNISGVDVKGQCQLPFDDEQCSRNQIQTYIDDYFGEDDHIKRQQLRDKIDQAVKNLIIANNSSIEEQVNSLDLQNNSHFFLWHTYFKDVFSRPSLKETGFDICIGNPPYISAPNQIASPELNEQRTRIVESKKYRSLYKKWDLYIPFMECGLRLLGSDGIFSMIVPYPLTNQEYAKILRKIVTEEYAIFEIADLNGTKIFENAEVSNCITFIRNRKPGLNLRITHIQDDRSINEFILKPIAQLKQDERKYVWNLTDEIRDGNRYPHLNVLGDLCYISKGMVLNSDEKNAKGSFKKEDLISPRFDDAHPRKYIEAKDVEKYHIKRVRFLEWGSKRCPGQLSRPTFQELYECPKILLNSIGSINATIDTRTHYLHNHSITCAVLWKDLKEVKNKSISSCVKKYSRFNREKMESLSNDVDLFYLLGVLNSSTAVSLLSDLRGGAMNIYPEHIRNIPIALPSQNEQKVIGDLVRKIIEKKSGGEDYSSLQRHVDALIEDIYSRG
ncbi:MAG: Eco57I restriction-modification methylase domain-containing protein, partial [Prevotella sp.]|nr:Eco57I restriction-modification methylase domain-containing protein [Prevotella sp.]